GPCQNRGWTASFATLAIFNPDETFLVTAGGEGELKGGLQVWSTPPAGGRGSEVARLFTRDRIPPTCAAFAPSGTEIPFLAVGTEKGNVHLWQPPSDPTRTKSEGRVAYLDPTDPRYWTVRVELDNKLLNLP